MCTSLKKIVQPLFRGSSDFASGVKKFKNLSKHSSKKIVKRKSSNNRNYRSIFRFWNHCAWAPVLGVEGLPYKFGLIFIRMKQKKNFFEERNGRSFKMANFSKSPILELFSQKFHRLELGLVGLIDVKAINIAQPIWSWGCLT